MDTDTQTAETAQTETAQTTATEAREPTLDDVYRDAGLDKVAAHDTQQVQQQQQPAIQTQTVKVEPSSIPDPYDAENFKAYLAQQAAGTTAMQKAVGDVVRYLTTQEQTRAAVSLKADVDQAVSAINEVVNHPKPKVIEAALDGMVRDDPRLRAIWTNRGKNPGAWQNAVKIVTKQIAEDFAVKVDPDLQKAQRARKESQKQMATTADKEGNPLEERLGAATGSDFERQWEVLVGR